MNSTFVSRRIACAELLGLSNHRVVNDAQAPATARVLGRRPPPASGRDRRTHARCLRRGRGPRRFFADDHVHVSPKLRCRDVPHQAKRRAGGKFAAQYDRHHRRANAPRDRDVHADHRSAASGRLGICRSSLRARRILHGPSAGYTRRRRSLRYAEDPDRVVKESWSRRTSPRRQGAPVQSEKPVLVQLHRSRTSTACGLAQRIIQLLPFALVNHPKRRA